MEQKKPNYALIVAGVILASLFLTYVWPTRYHLVGDGGRLQRIDRFTGKRENVPWR